jgi:hypothetical protein
MGDNGKVCLNAPKFLLCGDAEDSRQIARKDPGTVAWVHGCPDL